MAMSRSLLGRVMRPSSTPLLPFPGASPSPFAVQFLSGASLEAPVPSPHPTPAAARSLLARSGLPPATGVRSYGSSSGSGRQFSTKEDIKDKGTDDGMLVKLISRFLKKIGHPSQFTVPGLEEWGEESQRLEGYQPQWPYVRYMFTGALVIVWVTDNWKHIKGSFNEFVHGLTSGPDRNAQDKKD